MIRRSLLLLIIMGLAILAQAQPDARGALLRSTILPGWGHLYVNSEQWNTGKIHMFADLTLVGGYFGFRINANRLEENMYSYASLKSGVNISNRNRQFKLALTNYNSLAEYNDFQNRSRNWDRILPETPQNNWNWESDKNRREYTNIYNRIESSRQQLPAILSLMIVNRIISGVGAFRVAQSAHSNMPSVYFHHDIVPQLNIQLRF